MNWFKRCRLNLTDPKYLRVVRTHSEKSSPTLESVSLTWGRSCGLFGFRKEEFSSCWAVMTIDVASEAMCAIHFLWIVDVLKAAVSN